MGRKKKGGRKKHTTEKVLLATAIVQLFSAMIEIINRLLKE